jgi:lipid-binding SYLF domain-containing protein
MINLPIITGLSVALAFAHEITPDKRLRNAAEAFQEIMGAPDKAIPKKLLDRSSCVIIVPGMKKVALGIGGVYGRGFVSCRTSGHWGAPAGIQLAGGSFGLQLGAQVTDVVMLVMNESGVKKLLSDKFTVGAEASATAGPVGRGATADTDILMTAEIISWSRSRGIFGGVSLDGTVVTGDSSENKKLYGTSLSTREIIEGNPAPPPAAQTLLSVLEKYSPGSKEARFTDRRFAFRIGNSSHERNSANENQSILTSQARTQRPA